MQKSYQYVIFGGIVSVAFVMGIFASPLTTSSNESIQIHPSQTVPIDFGGYAIIEAFHADRSLYYQWEGHNALQDNAKSILAACISGVDSTPLESINKGTDCFGLIDTIVARDTQDAYNIFSAPEIPLINSLNPPGCDSESVLYNERCDGWESKATFDFTSLSCTPNIDCPYIDNVFTRGDDDWSLFNGIDFPPVQVVPGDKLIVTLTFSIT